MMRAELRQRLAEAGRAYHAQFPQATAAPVYGPRGQMPGYLRQSYHHYTMPPGFAAWVRPATHSHQALLPLGRTE